MKWPSGPRALKRALQSTGRRRLYTRSAGWGWVGVRFLLAEDGDPLQEQWARRDIFGFESQVAGLAAGNCDSGVEAREGGEPFVLPSGGFPDVFPCLAILGNRQHQALGSAIAGAVLNHDGMDHFGFAQIDLHPGIFLGVCVEGIPARGTLASQEGVTQGRVLVLAGRAGGNRRVRREVAAEFREVVGRDMRVAIDRSFRDWRVDGEFDHGDG